MPTLQESWRLAYRSKRYLKSATDLQLKERLQDLLGNTCDLTAEAKLAFKDPRRDCFAIERFTHLWEELVLRGDTIPSSILDNLNLLVPDRDIVRRAVDVWRGRPREDGKHLFKFGKAKYLRPLFKVGSLRLMPASSYKDESLNRAVRDNELEFEEELYGVTASRPPNRDYTVPKSEWVKIPIIGNVRAVLQASSNYYVLCLSKAYDYRLYIDFEADACLAINDDERFALSIARRVKEVLPGWKCSVGNVIYRDPYFPSDDADILFTKHFRHAYQKELRFVWVPPNPVKDLKPIHLELGPLTDYCELLEL